MDFIQIDQATIAQFVKMGGQYLMPVAALLRALYSGLRGKFPEGFLQISAASLFAGFTAILDNQNPDFRQIILEILGNTVFMAGLLSFIMVYLIKQPDQGKTLDGAVGAGIGLVSWLVWVYILLNPWPWWTAPLVMIAGAAAFIVLRILLRQIVKLVKIATYFLVLGLILAIGAGGVYLLVAFTSRPA